MSDRLRTTDHEEVEGRGLRPVTPRHNGRTVVGGLQAGGILHNVSVAQGDHQRTRRDGDRGAVDAVGLEVRQEHLRLSASALQDLVFHLDEVSLITQTAGFRTCNLDVDRLVLRCPRNRQLDGSVRGQVATLRDHVADGT